MYYIQSIQNIVESIVGTNEDVNRSSIYAREDKGYLEVFKLINTKDLEEIVMQLRRKKRYRGGNNQ